MFRLIAHIQNACNFLFKRSKGLSQGEIDAIGLGIAQALEEQMYTAEFHRLSDETDDMLDMSEESEENLNPNIRKTTEMIIYDSPQEMYKGMTVGQIKDDLRKVHIDRSDDIMEKFLSHEAYRLCSIFQEVINEKKEGE